MLFLDDDMRPPPNWLDALAGPIVAGEADATVSQFRAGAGRDRPWLKDDERALFITEHSVDNDHPFLVGGSMAISRAAYDFCGGFDERLGPGVLGAGGEDLLMTYQLENAGYRIASVAQVVTEHWFDEAKLTRLGVRERRVASAMSEVWLAYHWFGRSDALERPKLVLLGVAGRVLASASELGDQSVRHGGDRNYALWARVLSVCLGPVGCTAACCEPPIPRGSRPVHQKRQAR